jgi:hypothetical protein
MRRPETFSPSENLTPSDDEINVNKKIVGEIKRLSPLIATLALCVALYQSCKGSQLEDEIKKNVGISEPPCGTVLTIEGLKNPSELSIGGSKVRVEITGGETFFYGSEKIRYGRSGPSVILEDTDKRKKLASLEAGSVQPGSVGSEVKIRITCGDKDSKPNPTSKTIPDRSPNASGPIPEPTLKETPSTKNEPSNPSTPTPEQQAPSSQAPSSVDKIRCFTIGDKEVFTAFGAWMRLEKPRKIIQIRGDKTKTIESSTLTNLKKGIAEPPFKGVRIGDQFCAELNPNQK